MLVRAESMSGAFYDTGYGTDAPDPRAARRKWRLPYRPETGAKDWYRAPGARESYRCRRAAGRVPPVPVAGHHIDTNHHVNNAQYVQVAREAVPGGL